MSRNIQSFLMILKVALLGSSCFFLIIGKTYCQGDINFKPTENPVAPSVYQFLKLTEMPVNEYSGQVDISIPVYTIKTGSLEFPLALQYQAGGIKVNEEAGCVGLGWSLPIGTITQVIQDRDDLSSEIIKLLPDYFDGYYYPRLFPPYMECFSGFINTNIPVSSGIQSPTHQWVIYCDYYIPYNGQYSRIPEFFTQSGCPGGGLTDCYDSEPDMFNLNVNGHQISFILDQNFNIVTLNDHGNRYKLSFISASHPKQGFKCLTPSGETYYFDLAAEVNNELTSIDGGPNTNSFANFDTTTRVWYVSKITDPNNNSIEFKYNSTDYIRNLPTANQKYMQFSEPSLVETCTLNGPTDWVDKNDPQMFINAQTYTETYKTYTGQYLMYCDTMSFSGGFLVLYYSNREDIVNDKRLDSVLLFDINNNPKKKWKFEYQYCNSNLTIPSSMINLYNKKTENELRKRLILNKVFINNDKPFCFDYNNLTGLPPKLSYSVDYWGYNNGVSTNTSWLPNPAHIGFSGVPNNSEDHRPNLKYAVSGTMRTISYPTGLEKHFTYELHKYSPSVYNDIDTIGSGLRIKSVCSYDEGKLVDSCVYTYSLGQTFSPSIKTISTMYELVKTKGTCCSTMCGDFLNFFHFPYKIINSSSFFNTLSYLPISNIGYGKVSKQRYTDKGTTNGKVVHTFVNNDINRSIASDVDMTLPSMQNYYQHTNGSVLKEEFYNSDGAKVREINHSYQTYSSQLYYGAKVSFYKLKSCQVLGGNPGVSGTYAFYVNQSLDLVGYYPIYGRVSYPASINTINWAGGIPVQEKTKFEYDSKKQLAVKKEFLSNGDSVTTSYFYPYNYNTGFANLLMNRNIISQPTYIQQFSGGNFVKSKKLLYNVFDDLLLPSVITTTHPDYSITIDGILDDYDEKGNLLLWHKPDSPYSSMIYNETKTEIIASCNNSTSTECGFTSFEQGELNGWQKWPANYVVENATLAHSGTHYLKTNSESGPFRFFDVGSEAENHSGYKASVWVKGNQNAYIHVEVAGVWSTHVRKTNTDGGSGWNLLEVELPKEKFRDYMGSTLQIKAYMGGDPNALFDDIRFYPSDASMTTYTYKPLIGITSESDPKNIMKTYEYDAQGRLRLIRDHDGNILKKFEYNYAH